MDIELTAEEISRIFSALREREMKELQMQNDLLKKQLERSQRILAGEIID